MNIEYFFFNNPDIRARAEQLVESALWALPSWAYQVDVSCYEADPANQYAAASVFLEPEYRRIEIKLYDHLWTELPERQARALLHEVTHALLAQMSEWVKHMIEDVTDEGTALRRTLDREWRERVETTTQEVTYILQRLVVSAGHR